MCEKVICFKCNRFITFNKCNKIPPCCYINTKTNLCNTCKLIIKIEEKGR